MDRLAQIQAILADAEQRAALTDPQVGALERELLGLFDAVRSGAVADVPATDATYLRGIADTVGELRGVAAERFTAAESEAAEAQRLADEIAEIEASLRAETQPEQPDATPPEPERQPEQEPAEPATPEEPAEPAPAEVPPPAEPAPAPSEPAPPAEPAQPAEARVPVAAAAAPAAPPLSAITPPAPLAARPAPARTTPRWESLVDGREINGFGELAELLTERHRRIGHTPEGFSEDVPIARQRVEYPAELVITEEDSPASMARKLDMVSGGDDALDPGNWTEAMVASGGWCAPPEVDYSIPTISEGHRPLRDGLPRSGASRGALTFRRPPTMGAVVTGGPAVADAAIGIWTATIDKAPGGNTKDCQVVPCATTVTVELDAVYRCLRFGNMQSRADNELVQAWLRNTEASWARHGEQKLLDEISANSTPVTSARLVGLYRDLLAAVAQAAARYRNFHRMRRDARLRVLFPGWVIEAMVIDRVREQAGNRESLVVTEAEIRAELSDLGVNVTFYEDSRTGAGQVMGAQGASTDIRNLPDIVEWYLFHEGAFVVLENGELDLGIVRDSVLIGTNDYITFYETFEHVAFRGFESLRFRSTWCPDGSSALPISTAGACAAS